MRLITGLRCAIAVASAALVALTASVASHVHWLLTLDDELSKSLIAAAHANSALRDSARVITQLGNPVVIDIVIAVLAYLPARQRQWRTAATIVLIRLVGLAVEYALKTGVDRPRPTVEHPLARAVGASFPSGHSAGPATVATLLIIGAATHRSRDVRRGRQAMACPGRPRPLVVGILVAAAIAVAASRVILGVHYLSDVVAGLCLGVASVTGVLWATVGWRRAEIGPPLTSGT